MKYYIDCEFDNQGHSSPLLSMALVREDGVSVYFTTEYAGYGLIHDQWVTDNVMPLLYSVPVDTPTYQNLTRTQICGLLNSFFTGDGAPHIIADWPVDIKYLCDAIITGPGTMIDAIMSMSFALVRVDAYPSTLRGVHQHNAWWDAMALRYLLTGEAR